ncbi:MAG: hypothetical protein M1814_003206 [Vezdaea aestivalis]|nr:MAG: hypothetical protein M1814_003206 [Vezdaea aestivalis]
MSTVTTSPPPSNAPVQLTGSCYCGSLAWAYFSPLPTHFSHCHCSTCRRLHSAPFLTFGQFREDKLRWVSESSLRRFNHSPYASRYACADCYCFVAMKYHCEPDEIYISATSIKEDDLIGRVPEPKHHIFISQKAPWYEVSDNLPQYPRYAPGFEERMMNWSKGQT